VFRVVRAILCDASMTLCIAAGAMWFRSHSYHDELRRNRAPRDVWVIESERGGVTLLSLRARNDGFGSGGWTVGPCERLGGLQPMVVRRQPAWRLLGFEWDRGTSLLRWSFRVPFWFVTAALAALPHARVIRRLRRDRSSTLDSCPACGYNLRGTPGRCPECGTSVLSMPPSPTQG
jgi:hypothetical protein